MPTLAAAALVFALAGTGFQAELFAQKVNRVGEGRPSADKPEPKRGGSPNTTRPVTRPAPRTVTPSTRSGTSTSKTRTTGTSTSGTSTGKTPSGKSTAGKKDPNDFQYDENVFDLDLKAKKGLLDRIQWKLTLWSSGNYFNDADLRTLDETNETNVELTDDAGSFFVSGVRLDTFFPVNERLDIRMDIYKTGFWGVDQLGGRDNNNDPRETFNGSNTVSFALVYMDIHLFKNPTDKKRLDLIIGRQPFKIGGEVYRDYLLTDVLDSVVLKWHHPWLGKFNFLILDVFSQGSHTEDINFVQFVSFSNERVQGFDGDVNTFRTGLNYEYELIGDSELGGTHLEGRAFFYYAKFGGVNDGGSDRTNVGTSGNFPDNDFSTMYGFRITGGWKEYVRGALTYAESSGIDRKRAADIVVNQDVDTNGKALGLDVEGKYKTAFLKEKLKGMPVWISWLRYGVMDEVRLLATYFRAEGGKYNSDGVQNSHGFVGFKGDQAGGILTDKNWGMHPSAYIDDDGIDDFPYERVRRTGTEVQHLGLRLVYGDFTFLADIWVFYDTNTIKLFEDSAGTVDQNARIAAVQPIFPNDTTAIAASRRFGAPLGQEVNFGFEWQVYPNWQVWATAGIFEPGRYFSTPGLVQGAPQGGAVFKGFQLGTKLFF